MKDFKSPDDLKEFLLSTPADSGEDIFAYQNKCYSLSWKKDHWIVRSNNKKIGLVNKSDIPDTTDIKDIDVVSGMLSALRKGASLTPNRKLQDECALESLNIYLKGM